MRLTFGAWEGGAVYGENLGGGRDKALCQAHADDRHIGFVIECGPSDYAVQLGTYPDETTIGLSCRSRERAEVLAAPYLTGYAVGFEAGAAFIRDCH